MKFLVLTCESDSYILERAESDLSKLNWLCDVILLHSNSVGTLGQVFIVSHSYQTYFSFLELDLNQILISFHVKDDSILPQKHNS